MTIQVIRYLLGGLLFNTLCGAVIGMLLAVTLKQRLHTWTLMILMGLISALLIGGSLWVQYQVPPNSVLQVPSGLLIHPFLNKITGVTFISGILALLLDAAWMTGFGTLAWRRIRKRQEASHFPPRTRTTTPTESEHTS